MRMDKSWAVQFRMKLGARVHESKTPLVSYFQTPENGGAPPGWYLLLEETASARTLSLHDLPQLCGGEQRAGRGRVDDRRRLGGRDDDDDARDRLGRAD